MACKLPDFLTSNRKMARLVYALVCFHLILLLGSLEGASLRQNHYSLVENVAELPWKQEQQRDLTKRSTHTVNEENKVDLIAEEDFDESKEIPEEAKPSWTDSIHISALIGK